MASQMISQLPILHVVQAQLAQISDTRHYPFYVAMFLGLIVLAIVGIWQLLRVLAGTMDEVGVERYLESRGGRVLAANWTPQASEPNGKRRDRTYVVRYTDAEGHEHEAHCIRGLWAGIRFSHDSIVKPAQASSEASSLEAEDRRLRAQKEEHPRGQA